MRRLRALDYAIKYLSTFENQKDKDIEAAKKLGHQVIREMIQIPNFFRFDELNSLAIYAVFEKDSLFKLYQVFLNGDLAQYRTYVKANQSVLKTEGSPVSDFC
jgi:hypothetical protein